MDELSILFAAAARPFSRRRSGDFHRRAYIMLARLRRDEGRDFGTFGPGNRASASSRRQRHAAVMPAGSA